MQFWRDGYGIQGQDYVTLLPENELSAGCDILDAIIVLGTGSLLYHIYVLYYIYIYIYTQYNTYM